MDEATSVSYGRMLTAQELADYLNLPVTWIWTKAREGKIPCYHCGHYYRFDLRAVLEALKQGYTGEDSLDGS